MIFRLKIKRGRRWYIGIREYSTHKEAKLRKEELCGLGIQAEIVCL